MGILFENIKSIQADPEELLRVKAFLQRVLGITLVPLAEKEVKITAEIQQLLNDRKQAREDKDWARSDAIRDRLSELGVDTQDQKV